ncbi:hypothetical protein RGQ15_01380 [Paracoccus sp. MBLB3053]|uniref:Uncharacterized protein n=1 Tax=Paracoccus aurantius TaxID=3073814 RepID=A0ABU2HMG0_9RHOB|nr:hypothetical protein [Paracoccus sp. MBLB3053]MDS9466225.1 hypothetical protein [Paracoccus sp. MBLB3053]
MNFRQIGLALMISALAATAASAESHWKDWRHDNHRNHDHHRGDRRHDDRHDRDHHRHDSKDRHRSAKVVHCPPGLVWKGPSCVPPGQARKYRAQRIGDRFDARDYYRIQNPGRYDLGTNNSAWSYYSNDNQVYQVDSKTQKIMSVISLMQMMNR